MGPNDKVRALQHIFTSTPEITAHDRDRVRGTQILFIMAAHGHVAQEVLKPLADFERAGCAVTIAGLSTHGIDFDPISQCLALAESLWDPTWQLMAAAARDSRFDNVASLREFDQAGTLDAWLDRFDAVVVPGGHGRVFHAFLYDPLTNFIVRRFDRRQRVVGLMCHAGLIAAHADGSDAPLGRDRVMTTWPRAGDRFFGAIPLLGRYMVPYSDPVAVLLESAGARVHDRTLTRARARAAVDGTLATCRGPWATAAFSAAVLRLLAERNGKADT